MANNERPPLTNRPEDLEWMRQQTHRFNVYLELEEIEVDGLDIEVRDYFRHVIELIQLVEAQRDLIACMGRPRE